MSTKLIQLKAAKHVPEGMSTKIDVNCNGTHGIAYYGPKKDGIIPACFVPNDPEFLKLPITQQNQTLRGVRNLLKSTI